MQAETIRKAVDARRITVPAVWEGLDAETRQLALQAAIADDPAVLPALRAQLAGLPGLRPATVQKWSARECVANALRRRALNPVLMEAALAQLHLQHREAMLGAFLDELGLPHENGLLTEEFSGDVGSNETVRRAAEKLSRDFETDAVVTYFLTLLAIDPALWAGLWEWLDSATER